MADHRLLKGQIRDPVHGYVATTAIERAILDDRRAQRLRGVHQSAAAQLVFPTMTVTRFAHSLGAMHLASRFLASTLANTAPETRDGLVQGLTDLVAEEEDGVLGRDAQSTAQSEALLRRQGLHGLPELVDARQRVATLIAEQALRLVSLLHDLGHLPFSHDFEEAIAEWLAHDQAASEARPQLTRLVQEDRKLHESIGSSLADWVQDELRSRLSARLPPELVDAARTSLRVAKRVLHAKDAPIMLQTDAATRAARWLLGLVSGEIDADRADYILRDARHYGLGGAEYDVNRLVANLSVHGDGGPEPEWSTVVLAHGVSAAEEFLVARFREYQWAIYHHKIQQAAAGLRRALRFALSEPDAEVRLFLDDLEALVTPRAVGAPPEPLAPVYLRFADYTDAWWTERLKSRLGDPGWPAGSPGVRLWAELFLYRARGPRSLWKKPTDLNASQLGVLARCASLAADDDERWHAVVKAVEDEYDVLIAPLLWSPWKVAPGTDPPASPIEGARIQRRVTPPV